MMKTNIVAPRAIVSLMAAVAIAPAVNAGAQTQKKDNRVVISGSGRSIVAKETNKATVSSSKAAQMNSDYQKGFDVGYRAGVKAGYQNGYVAGEVRATGAQAAALSATADKADFGGTAQFQAGYQAGFKVGYSRSYNAGVTRGYNNQIAYNSRMNAAAAYADAANNGYANGYYGGAGYNNGYGYGNAPGYYGGGGYNGNSGVVDYSSFVNAQAQQTAANTGLVGVNNNSLNAFNNGLTNNVNSQFLNGFAGNQFANGSLVVNNGFNNGTGIGFNNTGFVNTSVLNGFNSAGNASGAFNNGFNLLVNRGLSNFASPFSNGFNNVNGFNSNFNNNLSNFNGIYNGYFNSRLGNFTGGTVNRGAVNTGTTATTIRR